MKKRIYIIISSILLLLLSGCDAILDSVYPPDINNSIEVNLNLADNLDSDFVKLQLVPLKANNDLDLNAKITVEIYSSDQINYVFSQLPAKTYRAFAFVDTDGNDIPGWTEPSTELNNLTDISQFGQFNFEFNDEDLVYSALGFIENYANIGNHWLEKLNEGTVAPPDFYDKNFSINGPEFLTTTYNDTAIFNIQRNDNTLTATAIVKFYDSLGEITFSTYGYNDSTNNLTVDFSTASTNFLDGEKLKIEVELSVIFNGNELKKTNSFWVTFNEVESGFYLDYGPSSIDKDLEAGIEIYYDVKPLINNTKTIDYVQWRVTDSVSNSILYNGSYGFNTSTEVDYLGVNGFRINLGQLDPTLDDSWWVDEFMIIKVKVFYTDNTIADNFFYIGLY